MRARFKLAIPAILAVTTISAWAQERKPRNMQTVQSWISSHAIPIQSVRPGSPLGDLQPLSKILKRVKVIGLGEGTHGTREFFQFKHRLVEFLVTKLDFNTFALETSAVACFPINDYVMHGKGDPAHALANQGLWAWDTQEILAMIEWMRAHNSRLPEAKRIRFVGFDIHNNQQAFPLIESFIKTVAPDHLDNALAAIASYRDATAMTDLVKRPEEKKKADLDRLQDFVSYLQSNRSSFTKRTSSTEFSRALRAARTLLQSAETYSSPQPAAGNKREAFMAKNVEELVADDPKARVMVWSHNVHVSKGENGGMGKHLNLTFGHEYYALGQTFSQGSFQARELISESGGSRVMGGLREFTVGPAPEGSINSVLDLSTRNLRFSDYLIDFRSAPEKGPVADWLGHSQPMFVVASAFSTTAPTSRWITQITPLQFDGMVFIRNTTRARPNSPEIK